MAPHEDSRTDTLYMPPRSQATPTTPKARLAATIKSARDIMRKDAGLNGDLDRLPQLSWLLFLRAFDGLVDGVGPLLDPDYRPAIDDRHQWKTWAGNRDLTGDELLEFVDRDLLPYLRSLVGDDENDPRNVISTVFKDTHNRMLSGVLLRDLINKVGEVHFTSGDDIHTMAFLYESLLKEMRDAAGDSGEFYTPRPVIRFMVQQSFLELGESILDPACGTGGFLVEAYEALKGKIGSPMEQAQLHHNLRGIEKKSLSYLLGVMNLLLHGVDRPRILRDNALVRMCNETGPRNQVKVVLTNPPFGGEEETSVAKLFPPGFQTQETAWLFLKAILDKVKRNGRCAIVLPNGSLFGGGVGTRIKERLLAEANLHTVVRLPASVFAPYTDIPTNILFFEKPGPTREVWFYQIPTPQGRRGYSKTMPMRFEEFDPCANWWGGRERINRAEGEFSWRVTVGEIEARDYNFDFTNPHVSDNFVHRAPEDIVDEFIKTEREILDILLSLQVDLGGDR